MIFRNPAGAPELACDECGCRWFDRMSGNCYECGSPVGPDAQAEYRRALEAFRDRPSGGRSLSLTEPNAGRSPSPDDEQGTPGAAA